MTLAADLTHLIVLVQGAEDIAARDALRALAPRWRHLLLASVWVASLLWPSVGGEPLLDEVASHTPIVHPLIPPAPPKLPQRPLPLPGLVERRAACASSRGYCLPPILPEFLGDTEIFVILIRC